MTPTPNTPHTPKPRRDTADDPVVREVRAIRRQLWEEGGKTIKGYLRLMAEMTRQSASRARPRRRKSA